MGSYACTVLDHSFIEAVYSATRFFGETFERPSIQPQLMVKDIPGWDSLNQAAFIISIEQFYGIKQFTLAISAEETLLDLYSKVVSLTP